MRKKCAIVARPFLRAAPMTDEKPPRATRPVNLTLTRDDMGLLDAIAQRCGTTRVGAVRLLIRGLVPTEILKEVNK